MDLEIVLRKGEGVPLRDSNLFAHQVDARDEFSHGVLHLETCVHFKEEKFARSVDQKLDGARPDVVASLGNFNGALAPFCA